MGRGGGFRGATARGQDIPSGRDRGKQTEVNREHHGLPSRRSPPLAPVWLALAALWAVVGGCSKTPSILWAHVSADDDVPMLSDLRATVVSLTHPDLEASTQRESLQPGDAGGAPAPFAFPVVMPITLNAEYVGDVQLTVEGLERTTEAVIASGTVQTSVIASKEMHVGVTISLVAPMGGGAGGAGGTAAVGAN